MATASTNQHDVVVIGAGVIGLACAWRAAERGLRVLVLERDRPGAGASNVAAGMLAPVGEATFGEDRLLELALESHRLWPGFAAELAAAAGADTGYAELGALHVALDRRGGRAAPPLRAHALARPRGRVAPAERLSRARAGPRIGYGRRARAARGGGGSAVAGRRAARGLRSRRGAIETGEVAEAVLDGERLAGVRTRDGCEHRARTTVLAAGSWSASEWLPAEARPPIRPVKGQILTLRGPAAEPVCERIVASERVYMVPRADGRLVVGATVEEQGFDTRTPPVASTSCCARPTGRFPTSQSSSWWRPSRACARQRQTTCR